MLVSTLFKELPPLNVISMSPIIRRVFVGGVFHKSLIDVLMVVGVVFSVIRLPFVPTFREVKGNRRIEIFRTIIEIALKKRQGLASLFNKVNLLLSSSGPSLHFVLPGVWVVFYFVFHKEILQ